MPTATSFVFVFPWKQMVGGFNAFMPMLAIPIALSVALILVFVVAGFIISAVKGAR